MFKYIKNSKGLNSIETVIISLIMLMMLSGLIDLTTIIRKQQAVSTTVSYVSRTLGAQGGVNITSNSNPYFPGKYITSSMLYNDIKRTMNDAGIDDSDWKVTVTTPTNGSFTLSPSTNFTTKLGKDIKINLTANYYWKLTSQVTPVKLKGVINSTRITVSSNETRVDNNINTIVN